VLLVERYPKRSDHTGCDRFPVRVSVRFSKRTIARQSIERADDTIHVESEKPTSKTGPDSFLRPKVQRIQREFNLGPKGIREIRETRDQGED
jgi:hypothetical protein